MVHIHFLKNVVRRQCLKLFFRKKILWPWQAEKQVVLVIYEACQGWDGYWTGPKVNDICEKLEHYTVWENDPPFTDGIV